MRSRRLTSVHFGPLVSLMTLTLSVPPSQTPVVVALLHRSVCCRPCASSSEIVFVEGAHRDPCPPALPSTKNCRPPPGGVHLDGHRRYRRHRLRRASVIRVVQVDGHGDPGRTGVAGHQTVAVVGLRPTYHRSARARELRRWPHPPTTATSCSYSTCAIHDEPHEGGGAVCGDQQRLTT